MPATARAVLERLAEQEKADGNLPALLVFYRELLEVQGIVDRQITAPGHEFSREAAKARLVTGKPLLEFDQLAIDWAILRGCYREVIALFQKHPELFGVLPAGFVAFPPGKILNRRTVKAWYRGRDIVLPTEKTSSINNQVSSPPLAEKIPNSNNQIPSPPFSRPGEAVPQGLLKVVFAAVLKPYLTREATRLSKVLEPEIWRRDYCPVCGGAPDLAYLARDTAARWLVCGRCDMEWLYQRMQCPYCANNDQNKISYFTDETEVYRLYVCDACRCYLKAIDLRKYSGEALMPLERLLTLDLDRQAQERGYQSGI